LCRLRGIPAELNPATDYEGLKAYDILIAGVPIDVKSDFMSWHTGNLLIEKNSLEHTHSDYFAYCIPVPSGITFQLFAVPMLREMYGNYPEKVVGDQLTNYAVCISKDYMMSIGQPFYQWSKQLMQQPA
jgi:hypothetical protein